MGSVGYEHGRAIGGVTKRRGETIRGDDEVMIQLVVIKRSARPSRYEEHSTNTLKRQARGAA